MTFPSSYDHQLRPRGPGSGQPAEPRAMPWLLLNPDDDPAVHAEVDSDEARARGILLVRLSPTSITVTHLVQDTLRALGLPHTIDRLADPDRLPRLLTHRLCGRRTSVLAIDCPHPLTANQLRCARRWCDHLEAQLVLITADPRPVHAANPADGLLTSAASLLIHTPRLHQDLDTDPFLADPDLAAQAAQLTGLTLPGDEFTTFRTSCLNLLPRHAKTIDKLYTYAYHRACDGASTRPRHQPYRSLTTTPSEYSPVADQVARAQAAVFHTLTIGAPTAPTRLIRLRATQAALFTHHRVLLRWDPPTPTYAPHTSLPGALLPDDDHATVLDRDLNPTTAARDLLAGLFELSWHQHETLYDNQVSLDPPALSSGNVELRIPAWAAPFLRAHRCARDHHTSHHSDRYFPDHLDNERLVLGAPHIERYQPVDGAKRHYPTDEPSSMSRSPNDPPPAMNLLDNWLHRRHLTITPLDIPARET